MRNTWPYRHVVKQYEEERAWPILHAQLDAEDRRIEVYALLVILAVEVMIYWVMR